MKTFANKILTAVSSTIVISLLLAIYAYTPIAERAANTGYESFGGLVFIYGYFTGFLYLTAGISISWIVDLLLRKPATNAIGYILGGSIVGIIFYEWGTPAELMYVSDLLITSFLGMLAAFIFWLIQKLIAR